MIRLFKTPLPGRPLPVAGLALLLVAWAPAWPAGAAMAPAWTAGPGGSQLLTAVRAKRCARLVPQGGREIIVNECQTCRIVNITRKRRGIAIPVSRSFNVQPNSTFPVPFRGPGRSRVTSVLPCKGEKGAAENLVNPSPKRKTAEACVSLEKNKAGAIVLVNKCRACKAALIERQDESGGGRQRQAYLVAPKAVIAVPAKGAGRVGLVGEINCR